MFGQFEKIQKSLNEYMADLELKGKKRITSRFTVGLQSSIWMNHNNFHSAFPFHTHGWA